MLPSGLTGAADILASEPIASGLAPRLTASLLAPSGFFRDASPLRAIPASARLQALLRENIVSLRLKPGAALNEKEIADAHGVSRTPVREALLRLAEERLVDVYPQYGTFVSRIRLVELKDAMVIRKALEAVTAREAAKRATKAGVAGLRRLVVRQAESDRADDAESFYAADEAFHQALAALAEHPNLWRVVRQEKAQVDRCRMLTLPNATRRRDVIAQHEAILRAVEAGDADAAELAMAAHLAEVLPSFEALPERHPDYFERGDGAARPQRASARSA